MNSKDVEVILINANLLSTAHKFPFKIVRRIDSLRKQWSSVLEKIAEIGKLGKEKEASEEEITKEIEDFLNEHDVIVESIPVAYFDDFEDVPISYDRKMEDGEIQKATASTHAIIKMFQEKGFVQ